MKRTLIISITWLVIMASLMFLPSCITDSLESINYYSGSWRVVFYDGNDNVISGAEVAVQDDGTFCSKLNQPISGSMVYLKGEIDFSGKVTGGFCGECSQATTGSFSGTFEELMGASYAYGQYDYSGFPAPGKGSWYARRY